MKPTIEEIQAVSMQRLCVGKDKWGEDLYVMGTPNAIHALTQALAIAKGDSVVIKAVLSDDDYNKAVSKSRKFLEMGMFFGEDPVEQIVHIVHKVLIEEAQEGAKDE